MTSYVTPKKNTAFITYIGLPSQAAPGTFKSNPTIASGDFKVSKDGGTLANLTNLPTVTPASGKMVQLSLTSTEMNADNITIVCSDASGAEWYDVILNIQTSARQIDDLAYPATSGRSIVVDAAGLVDANAVKLGPSGSGTALTARDIGASVLLSSGTGTGQLSITSGVVSANTTQWGGTAVASATVRADLINIAGVAVSASTAQLGVNVVNWKGSAAPAMTGDAFARLGAPAGASVSADVAAIKSDTATVISNQSTINTNVLAVAGNVWSVGTRTLTAGTNIVLAKGTGITGFNDPDAATISDAVWDETLSGHAGAGSTGAALAAAGGSGDPWATALPGAYSAGTAGKIIGDYIDAAISDVKAKTDNLPASPAATSDIPTADITAIKAKTDSLTFTVSGQIDANIQYVNDVQVNGNGSPATPWGP